MDHPEKPALNVIGSRTLPEWQQFARRDDCLDRMVPSDLRELVRRIGDLEVALMIEYDRTIHRIAEIGPEARDLGLIWPDADSVSEQEREKLRAWSASQPIFGTLPDRP